MSARENVTSAYKLAKARYWELGVDADAALRRLRQLSISLQVWQGDDIRGFESPDRGVAGGGILATGNYPGRPRNIDELRSDIEKALNLIPGKHRLNLHSIYLDCKTPVERDKIDIVHFQSWIDWAQQLNLRGLDFNPTFFSHPMAADGFTLSHRDAAVRNFWVAHAKACRGIAAEMGRQMKSPSVCNIWIPDGYKDRPADRSAPRRRLLAALDEIFATQFETSQLLDALEGKLFGLGTESYTVGSHEFYLGYAVSRNKLLCLDSGHFHPTESIADKLSSVMCYVSALLLHVSRGVRWDSDHVVILDDETQELARELVHGDFLSRVHLGLDFFDGSINRIAAWIIGSRSLLKALLLALLEPVETLKRLEEEGDFTGRLALCEHCKTLPAGAVWDYYCLQQNVPLDLDWLTDVRTYETSVLSKR